MLRSNGSAASRDRCVVTSSSVQARILDVERDRVDGLGHTTGKPVGLDVDGPQDLVTLDEPLDCPFARVEIDATVEAHRLGHVVRDRGRIEPLIQPEAEFVEGERRA